VSKTEIINEEPVDTGPQSSEDKFFGVTTEINSELSDEIEVQVVDDVVEEKPKSKNDKVDNDEVDAEISNYSQRASDRINEIKYQYHEERRAKETSEQIAQEAAQRLQTVMQENQRLQQMVEQGGNVLNQTAYNNALWAKQSATEKYKKAYDEGDAEAMAQAQELLSKATLAEQQAGQTAQQVQNHIIQSMPVEPTQNIAQPKKNLDPDMDKWARQNPWFMGQEPFQQEMTAYALAIDVSLRNEGILPENNPDEYYSSVDSSMKQRFPKFFGVQQESDSEMVVDSGTPRRQPQTVVASATRDSGNKKPTQIRLNKAQVALARQLGITPEQYANQLLKEA
tara:strand:- start:1146 stop:2162 length:1017 start_codon:yes stop_codon:yes gene_type:complete